MRVKKDYAYAIVAPTSMGVRLTPLNRQPVHTSNMFFMQATSAESNVVSLAASLGLGVKLLTAFVEDSDIALFIKRELQKRNIEFEAAEVPQGGPWGYRHQFNIADAGFGMRGPKVLNDRAGEVGRSLCAKDFELNHIFEKEGAAIVHMSGLIAALSPETSGLCLEMARAAKKAGTLVSFDINYRASFWQRREEELREVFCELAGLADILVGNEEDFQLALGTEGPETGGGGLGDKIDGYKSMIGRLQKSYPGVSVFATTLREVISANTHLWGAIALCENEWHVIEPKEITVYDRIGGGDGFLAGLLYGMLRGWEPERWVQFGWAAGAFAATLETDYALPASEEQVWSLYTGNARVKR